MKVVLPDERKPPVDAILVELYVDDSSNKRDKNSKDCGKDKCKILNKGYEEIK